MLLRFLFGKFFWLDAELERKVLVLAGLVNRTLLTVLHDEVHSLVFFVFDDFDEADDVRMRNLLQNGDLAADHLIGLIVWVAAEHLLLQLVLLQNLNGVGFAGEGILANLDFGEGAPTDEILDEVLIDLDLPIFRTGDRLAGILLHRQKGIHHLIVARKHHR